MSIRTLLKQVAKQPHLEDLLMGDVDLDLMFGLDSESDEGLDESQLQAPWLCSVAPPCSRH